MFIRSERLFLRPFWPEDRPELMEAAAECDSVAEVPAIARPDGARQHEPEDRRCPRLLVTLPGAHGSRIVGSVGLERVDDAVEAGLWIAPAFRNRGFGTEAGRALVSLARTLGLDRLVARPGALSEPARRLLEKLGFEPWGESLALDLGIACGCGDSGDLLAA